MISTEKTEKTEKTDLTYNWNFQQIGDEIGDLKSFQELDARLKKLTKRMGSSIRQLLKSLSKEVNIIFGKKQDLLNMKVEEYKKISLEKLIGK